uniref:Gustatory receptor n=1 Tax=Tetranychus urticae TaxID=32264 RepID=T1KAN6_TETUR
MIKMYTPNETTHNLFAMCKPNGMLAKALYSGRKVVFLSCTLLLAVASITWTIYLWIPIEAWRKFYAMIYSSYLMIFGAIVSSVYSNRDKYMDCFAYFEVNANINIISPSLVKYLQKNRFIISILLSVGFFCYTVAGIVAFVQFGGDSIWYLIIRTSSLACYYLYLNFYVESCLYVQCCFIQVEHQIDAVNNSNSLLSLAKVRQVRRCYCIAIKTTEKLNSLLLPATVTFFVLSLIDCHYVFTNVLAFPSLVIILMFIAAFTNFFVVTYYIIYINHLAVNVYEKVYSFSFKTESLNVSKEIQLLLTRIARADVGLTWLGIFVITPTCVTSLATITLTVALAVPTLIKFIGF